MPIYEYLCVGCGHQLDALQKLSDSPLVDCPACAAPQLKRQMSAPSFRLKGAGWYETDFKNDKRRNLAESDSKAEDKPAAKDKDGAKDKPAATTAKADKADQADKSEPAGKADKPAAAAPAKSESVKAGEKKPDAGRVA
jgi:putative FmdB family regulatory protein